MHRKEAAPGFDGGNGPCLACYLATPAERPKAEAIQFDATHAHVVDWHRILTQPRSPRVPWNKGKLTGQKPPLKLSEIWAIRVRLQLSSNLRDLATFNLAIDSKLRACDLAKLRVWDVCHGERIAIRPNGPVGMVQRWLLCAAAPGISTSRLELRLRAPHYRRRPQPAADDARRRVLADRKSTRLNSSHT